MSDPSIAPNLKSSKDDSQRSGLGWKKYTFHVAPGMVNQVSRNGMMTKKTIDGRHSIRYFDADPYSPDKRSHTPDGGRIIHLDDEDPTPGHCTAFIHPPYGSAEEYRAEYGQAHRGYTNLEQLGASADSCGFCSILYQGIQQRSDLWMEEWATHRWFDNHLDVTDLSKVFREKPWLQEYRDELRGAKEIDQSSVLVNVWFPKGSPYVSAYLMVEPWATDHRERPRNRPMVTLEFYTDRDAKNPWRAFGAAPHAHSSVLGDACVDMMLGWIQDCHDNHSDCNMRVTPDLPSRLLHVTEEEYEDGERELQIRLVDTDPNRVYRYIALSHVWAETRPPMTTRSNLEQHKTCLPFEHLSDSIIDTMDVSRRLGLDYIWMDSLCIIQDDVDDWQREFPRMGMIYGNAYVTFVIHGSDLTLIREEPQPIYDPMRPDDPPVYCRVLADHENLFFSPSDTTSWFGRAWCLQERLFSPRMLHFGGYREEMFFECGTCTVCEWTRIPTDRDSLKVRLTRALFHKDDSEDPGVSRDKLWRVFTELCEDYTDRGLTFVEDTLPAVASFMSEFAPQLGQYYAGIWEHRLLLSLQWEALKTVKCSRHEIYAAPSWSWASRSGAVIWYMNPQKMPSDDDYEFPEVLEIATVPTGPDPFGQVSSGHIKLRGRVVQMTIKDITRNYPDERIEMIKEGTETCFVTLDSLQDLESIRAGQSVTCLDLMRDKHAPDRYKPGRFVSGLVMLPVEEDEEWEEEEDQEEDEEYQEEDEEEGEKKEKEKEKEEKEEGVETGVKEVCYRRIGFSTMRIEHFVDSVVEEVTII
ncbi:HET-domain-containing protein [Thozetella sp. PMI_491]|nr:HET-domain-containing protein [Thozetella sp. PMI_491]